MLSNDSVEFSFFRNLIDDTLGENHEEGLTENETREENHEGGHTLGREDFFFDYMFSCTCCDLYSSFNFRIIFPSKTIFIIL